MLAFSRGVGWRRAPEPLVKTTKANSWPKGPTKELFDELGRIDDQNCTFLQIQSSNLGLRKCSVCYPPSRPPPLTSSESKGL